MLDPILQSLYFKTRRKCINFINNQNNFVFILIYQIINFFDLASFKIGNINHIYDNTSIINLFKKFFDDCSSIKSGNKIRKKLWLLRFCN